MQKLINIILSVVIIVGIVVSILFIFYCPSEEDKLSFYESIPYTSDTVITQPTEVSETTGITEPTIEYVEPEVTTEPIELTEETIHEVTESTEEPKKKEDKVDKNISSSSSYYSYTEEELDLLARLINAEGGIESYETQLKIGSVVMNRVESSRFPSTIKKVIYQKGQFSVTTIKIKGVPIIDRPASKTSYKAAKEILENGSILPDTVMVFYAVGCKEPWVTSRATYEVCDNTVFAHIYEG